MYNCDSHSLTRALEPSTSKRIALALIGAAGMIPRHGCAGQRVPLLDHSGATSWTAARGGHPA
jgi:hypothetical protein